MDQLNFRISSALKNIIGKELITNKYVAIFELVKNSFDAYADKVEIIFENNKIIIKDDGKWMSLEDIKNKWLFVWYSAKFDNTENREYGDYRDKIKTRKWFAWAKWIGRFACDRLGERLKLISIKEGVVNSKVESINVNWWAFESDSKQDFINIEVTHETLLKNPYPDIKNGTILEITDLREIWNEEDKNALKNHLSKLINPTPYRDDIFEIFITYDGKKEPVDNFVFEKLENKTTQIKIDIQKKQITTELIDRWERIYKINEANPWADTLFDIKFTLFYLNHPAKIAFKEAMGVKSADFSSIFLYKNGFRVFPYGEPGEDLLKIDARKSQWYARYLGTRELLWMIEINNISSEFKETSSRDGWLLETKSYKDLKKAFLEVCLRRLEAYVVDTLDWTFKDENKEEWTEAQIVLPEDREEKIRELIWKLTKTKWYIELEYWYKFEEKIHERTKKWYSWAAQVIKEEARKTGNKDLQKAVEIFEESYERKNEELSSTQKKLEKTEEQNISLKVFLENPFFKNIADYHHDISIATTNIKDYLLSAFAALQQKNLEELEYIIVNIWVETEKINSISKVATRSWMQDGVHKKQMAINKKVEDYTNDYLLKSSKLKISAYNNVTSDFIASFRYFDLVTIIDNLIDNSKKNWAKTFKIELFWNSENLEINFIDDWDGLNSKYANNPDEIFEPRVTTTSWSWWWLTQIRDIVQQMGGEISVHPQEKWLKFKITFISWK